MRTKIPLSPKADVVHVLLAEASGSWSSEKRERVQRMIANFTLASRGLDLIRPTGNPVTAAELARLKAYTKRAQQGGAFTPEEAADYKGLSERIAQDYRGQDWVAELLKIALFIFAVYALSQALKTK